MKSLCIILLANFLLLSGGCSEQGRVSSDPPSLSGGYEGVYRIIFHPGDSIREVINWNYVLWTFDDDHYRFRIDPARHTGHCFCIVTGQYNTDEGYGMQTTSTVVDTGVGCNHCDASENPSGVFARETKGDSLILSQQDDSVHRQLRLLHLR